MWIWKNSEKGLKVHIKRQHTTINSNGWRCDLKIRRLKTHMKSYSYNLPTFKCAECEFTMDLHVGRFHCENFHCRLCDANFKNQDNLETHLPFDKFKWRECGKTGKRKNERTHR